MKIRFTEDLDHIEYAIRGLVPLAKKAAEKGREIIYLNIGDPLKYDFKTPKHIIEAAYIASMRDNRNYYGESQGIIELREAISEHEKRINNVDISPNDIIVTQGVSEGISFICRILLDRGDEALVPSPSYPLYINVPELYHARAVEYKVVEEEGWIPDIDDIRKNITDRTRFITIINPNNPTGSVYSEKVIRGIIDVAGEYGIPVVSDEIYNQIVFEGRFRSPASISKDVPVFVLNGFSKAYLMTGWRLGYVYIHDPSGENRDKAISLIMKMAMIRLSANTPAQYGAVAALRGPQDHIREINRKFRERSELMYKRLSEMPGISVVKPRGTFYIFPRISQEIFSGDDKKFVERLLLETGVFVVYGSGFGETGKGHFRAVTLPPEDIIRDAMDKIERFIRGI